jgi:tetratricopeptide (TPR) repeat protein
MKFSSFFLLFVIIVQLLFSQNENHKIERGWELFFQNKYQEAKNVFLRARVDESKNPEVLFGLFYTYSALRDYDKAFLMLQNALQNVDDPNPYLYALTLTQEWTSITKSKRKQVIRLLKQYSERKDSIQFYPYNIYLRIGLMYQQMNDVKKAGTWFDKLGDVRKWRLIGPFENISGSGFDKVFPPEKEFQSEKMYKGKNDVPVWWFQPDEIRLDHWLDMTNYFAFDEAVFYANTFVQADQEKEVLIRIGTSGFVKIFLNDQVILSVPEERNNDMDTYIVKVKLAKGWNRILVKNGFAEKNKCNFLLRITDLQGNPLPDEDFSFWYHDYPTDFQVSPVRIGLPPEQYFRTKIKEAKIPYLYQLLLIATYLHNDKNQLAEKIIRKLLDRFPVSVLLNQIMIEALYRGLKTDVVSLYEQRILQKAPDSYEAFDLRIKRLFQSNNMEKLKSEIKRFEKKFGRDELFFQASIFLYSQMEEREKLIKTVEEAYKRYPDNWTFVSLKATIEASLKRRIDNAIYYLKNYIKHHGEREPILTLIDVYLKIGNPSAALSLFDDLLKLFPSNPDFYYMKSDVLFQLGRSYDSHTVIQKAIRICPNSGVLYEKLGDSLKEGRDAREMSESDLQKVKDAYQKALEFNPTMYSVREKLRSIFYKKPISELFETHDINQIVHEIKIPDRYKNEPAVRMLYYERRVFYPEGASEKWVEKAYKIQNKEGVDDLKEITIYFNYGSEDLQIEEAYLIKENGDRIEPDQDGNQLVFKSLEEGDIIYFRYHLVDYYSGMLSKHIWGEFDFNNYYPTLLSHFSLLLPRGKKLHYQSNIDSLDVSMTEIEDFVRYDWKTINIDGIRHEYAMLNKTDVARKLVYSSIPDWATIVQWYLDVSEGAYKPTFEIKEQFRKLIPDSGSMSLEEKIARIYEFVTNDIRYSSVPFRQSGIIPQKARAVLLTKIGDCKDKATLFLSFAKLLGVEAYYVLVNTVNDALKKLVLPGIEFNHAMVAINLNGKLKYLDLTANDYPYGTLPGADKGAFALLIKPGVQAPFRLPERDEIPSVIKRIRTVELQKDHSIKVVMKAERSGATAGSFRNSYRGKSEEEKKKILLNSIGNEYSNLKLLSFDIQNLDTVSPVIRYMYDFTVPYFVQEAGSFKILKLEWADRFNSAKLISYEKRHFPFYFVLDFRDEYEEVRIHLPKEYRIMEKPESIEIHSPFFDYEISYSLRGNDIVATRYFSPKKKIIEVDEYEKFKTDFSKMFQHENIQLVLKKGK